MNEIMKTMHGATHLSYRTRLGDRWIELAKPIWNLPGNVGVKVGYDGSVMIWQYVTAPNTHEDLCPQAAWVVVYEEHDYECLASETFDQPGPRGATVLPSLLVHLRCRVISKSYSDNYGGLDAVMVEAAQSPLCVLAPSFDQILIIFDFPPKGNQGGLIRKFLGPPCSSTPGSESALFLARMPSSFQIQNTSSSPATPGTTIPGGEVFGQESRAKNVDSSLHFENTEKTETQASQPQPAIQEEAADQDDPKWTSKSMKSVIRPSFSPRSSFSAKRPSFSSPSKRPCFSSRPSFSSRLPPPLLTDQAASSSLQASTAITSPLLRTSGPEMIDVSQGGDESAVLSPVESSMPISSLVQGKSMTDPVSDSKASTTNFKFLSPGTSSEVSSDNIGLTTPLSQTSSRPSPFLSLDQIAQGLNEHSMAESLDVDRINTLLQDWVVVRRK